MDNVLTHWIIEDMRFRGEDTPSRCDFLLTIEPDIADKIKYGCPVEKSNHTMRSVRGTLVSSIRE